MKGRRTVQKALQQRSTTRTNTVYAVVGSWKLEENENGDLVAYNMATGSTTIIAAAVPQEDDE